MRNDTIIGTALVVGMMGLVGCSAATDGESDRDRLVQANTCSADEAIETRAQAKGLSLNGLSLNGLSLNGPVLNGLSLNCAGDPCLQGRQLNGPVIQGVELNGSALHGLSLHGTRFSGPAGGTLEGAELVGQLSDGRSVSIYVDGIRENSDPNDADVVLYQVSYGPQREPLCGRDANGAPLFATAIANVWDAQTGARIETTDRFTFACEGGALYKCIAAGYKPWKSLDTANGPASLADYHQACTRMIRADYCGDGTSFTKDGTLIDLGDAAGLQSFETLSRANFAFEASWGPNGATCVSKTRYPLTKVPSCLADRLADSCDDAMKASENSGGVLLSNRSATDNACLR